MSSESCARSFSLCRITVFCSVCCSILLWSWTNTAARESSHAPADKFKDLSKQVKGLQTHQLLQGARWALIFVRMLLLLLFWSNQPTQERAEFSVGLLFHLKIYLVPANALHIIRHRIDFFVSGKKIKQNFVIKS